jgi:outer membrane protein TolC
LVLELLRNKILGFRNSRIQTKAHAVSRGGHGGARRRRRATHWSEGIFLLRAGLEKLSALCETARQAAWASFFPGRHLCFFPDRLHPCARSASSGLAPLTAGSLNPAYNADLSLSLSQPLLKGGGTAVNRAAIEKAKLGVEKSGLDFKGQVLSVVRNVELAYHNLCYAREQLTVLKSSLQLAQKLFDEGVSRKTAGVATDLDVLQAEVGVSNARRNVIQGEHTLRNNQDNLVNLIGQGEFDTIIGETRLPDFTEKTPSFDYFLQAGS